MEPAKVVVRYANGKVAKGFTTDFFPNKPVFHVAAKPLEQGTQVSVTELKAVFFVRQFTGNRDYNDRKTFVEGQTQSGRKAEVTFKDGEVMVGTTLGYDPNRPGFFISPSDHRSNNMRVFVVSGSVKKFSFL